MQYILDNDGYIEEVSFDALITCNNKTCTEYIGSIPSDYSSLEDWSDNSNIRAYHLVDNNLIYDADKDAELQAQWIIEGVNNTSEITGNKVTNLSIENTDIQYPSAKAVYDAINDIVPPMGTDTKGSIYLGASSTLLTEVPTAQGYEELAVKKDDPGIKTYTYTLSEAYTISPFALYNLVLYIDDMQTAQKYNLKAQWYVGETLISEGNINELKPTTSLELISIPMYVNYLTTKVDLSSGDTMTLVLTIENNILVTHNIKIMYGTNTVSCLIRNGSFVSSQEVYDLFDGDTKTQAQINSELKNAITSGAIIEDNLTSTSATTCLSSNQGNVLYTKINKLKEYVLFINVEGTNGNITLNDLVENYDYLEIFGKNNDGMYGSQKIYNPNLKTIIITISGNPNSISSFWVKSASYYLSSNTMVLQSFNDINVAGSGQGDNSSNKITIYKVVGYKNQDNI